MKKCLDCSIEFVVTGKNHKRCKECAYKKKKEAIKTWAYKKGKLNGKWGQDFHGRGSLETQKGPEGPFHV